MQQYGKSQLAQRTCKLAACAYRPSRAASRQHPYKDTLGNHPLQHARGKHNTCIMHSQQRHLQNRQYMPVENHPHDASMRFTIRYQALVTGDSSLSGKGLSTTQKLAHTHGMMLSPRSCQTRRPNCQKGALLACCHANELS